MADVRIPIHLDLGDLGRLADVRREVEATRRVAAETQAQEQADRRRREPPTRRVPVPPQPPPPPPGTPEWETLPGGGIRRKGYQEQPATTPAVNDYVQLPDGRLVKKGWEGRVTPGTGATPPLQQAAQQATTSTQQNTKALGQVGTSAGRLSDHLQELNTTLKQESTEGGGRRPLSGRALQVLGAGAQLPPGQGRTPAVPAAAEESTGLSRGGRFAARTGFGLLPLPPGVGAGVQAGIGAAMIPGVGLGAATGIGAAVAVIAGAIAATTRGMEIYEHRARGVIAVGSLLSQNFDQVGESISMLRRDYQILNTESPQALEALGRITGGLDPATVRGIGRYAMAYGQDPVQAARQTGFLRRLAPGGGANPLALAGRVAGDIGPRGYRPMPLPEQADEVARAAQMGAAVGGQAPLSLYARQVALFGGMGEELQVPGGPTGRLERFYQGLNQAPNEAVHAVRVQAVEAHRRKYGDQLTVGRRTFDLSKPFDRDVVMSIASQIPELQESYMGQVHRIAGNRPELIPRLTHELIGGENMTLLQSWDLAREERRAPGILGRTGRPFSPEEQAEQDAEDARRLERRRARVENRPQEIAARLEERLEPVGEEGVRLMTNFEKKLLDLTDTMVSSGGTVDQLTGGFKELRDTMASLGEILERLGTASGASGLGQSLLDWLRSAATAAGHTPQTINGVPVLGDPFARPALPTTPQKPAR